MRQARRRAGRGRDGAGRRRLPWTARGARGAGTGEPVPGDEHERLAAAIRQPLHGDANELGLGEVLAHLTRSVRGAGKGEAPLERGAPVGRPALVGEDPARDPVQPGERVLRHVVEAAPGDEEGVGHDVLRRLGRRTAESVRPHERVVLSEQVFESLPARWLQRSPLQRVCPPAGQKLRAGSALPAVAQHDRLRDAPLARLRRLRLFDRERHTNICSHDLRTGMRLRGVEPPRPFRSTGT